MSHTSSAIRRGSGGGYATVVVEGVRRLQWKGMVIWYSGWGRRDTVGDDTVSVGLSGGQGDEGGVVGGERFSPSSLVWKRRIISSCL